MVGTSRATSTSVPTGGTLAPGSARSCTLLHPFPTLHPVAVDRLPSFLAAPNAHDGQPLPHHQCSIHLNCEGTHLLHQAFTEASRGHPSSR